MARPGESDMAADRGPCSWKLQYLLRMLVLVLVAFLMPLLPPQAESRTVDSRPNILFILTDDQRWDGLGAAGNPSLRTPHLDKLARRGMLFRRTFVGSPVCHPSRASFLSGYHPHQDTYVRDVRQPSFPDDADLVAHHLNRGGYHTGFIGKSHPTGDPRDWGFREVPAKSVEDFDRDVGALGRVFELASGETVVVEGDSTRFLVDHSIDFFRDNRESEPWFLWLALNAPHFEYLYDPDHPYFNSTLRRPPGYPDHIPFPEFAPYLEETFGSVFVDDFEELLNDFWRRYYSNIGVMDAQLGRLFDYLRKTGRIENTLIVFTSDNGVMHGSHHFLFKSIWYEESTRVPMIVHWPGRARPGSRTDALVSSVDFLPTFLDAAGMEDTAAANSEGRSFLPQVTGDRYRTRRYVFSESRRVELFGGGYWYMVRDDRYKYVEVVNDADDTDPVERYLYDLQFDPHEQKNLIGRRDLRSVRNRMDTRLEQFRQEPKNSTMPPDMVASSSGSSGCLVERFSTSMPLNDRLRGLRDNLLERASGRWMVGVYYALSESWI